MSGALDQNRQPPETSPTRFLGSVFAALLMASGLNIAIAGAQQPTAMALTKLANGLRKLNFPGATMLREPSLHWGFLLLAALLSFTTLAAAFLIASRLFPARGQQSPAHR